MIEGFLVLTLTIDYNIGCVITALEKVAVSAQETLVRHCTNFIQVFCVCWVSPSCARVNTCCLLCLNLHIIMTALVSLLNILQISYEIPFTIRWLAVAQP